ncbi:regulatory protein RecX [Secundilactobacillus pentosiphilus]|uniref:Regulatory protein RecX n=1 Tax=Secundilactobacillus pentosiphilus TaxID=1714682 RepID=A0A1Z5ITW0_9LACO|nr:recombination regulator RecX [Secundilactobacillus pentosiphilus]GAX05203.1 regulatory protein RecX [Secundilactobacillus pentosiphilus]
MAGDSSTKLEITKIEAQKRAGRYNVYVNGHYAFPVSEDVLIRYRLLKGTELTADMIKTLESADDQSKAYELALNYLSYQQRTEKELSDYLVKKEVPETTVAPVMARLIDDKLLDDEHYAHSYVRTMKRTSDKGPSVIRRQLKQRGVKDELIDNALAEDYQPNEQLERLSELVKKLKRQYQKLTPKIQRQKVQQRLVEKGFSFDLVGQALAETSFEMDSETELALLSSQAEKLWRRYHAKPERERQLKIRQSLYRKGFSGDLISRWLEQKAEEES